MGVKSDFYFMTFFDPRPNNRFGRVLAFLALLGYLGYFWSELNGTLKFGTEVGVKSDFCFMTFFGLRPNKGFGHVLALSGREEPACGQTPYLASDQKMS